MSLTRAVRLGVLCLFVGGLLPCLSFAQQAPSNNHAVMPNYIEDFFLSDAVRSEDKGETQVTLSAIKQHNNRSPEDGASTGLDLEYGVTNRLQIAVELPYGLQATPSSELSVRWSALSTGAVYQFIRSSDPFALSAGANIEIPLTPGTDLTFEPELLVAKEVGKTQIHASVEPEISGDETALAYNLDAVRPLPHNFYPTFEFNGRRNEGINSFYLTPGIFRRLPNRFLVGLGVPIGASARSSRIGAVLNLTWEVGGDKDDD
jgi:hypothetical protein